MRKYTWHSIAILVILIFLIPLAYGYLHTHTIAVLSPRGTIAYKERSLMLLTVLLGLLVLLPVFALTFGIAWRYREGNKHATYSPHLTGSLLAETVWWVIPLSIITVLSVVTWHSSHTLDPRRAIISTAKPIKVQVVALEWKWLFIYPQQHVASVNYLAMPVNTPVDFEITADAPMNSFWIPQLGGQIYAMPGMSTELHLMASQTGTYRGSSANISGEGFADMHFTTQAESRQAFNAWVAAATKAPQPLTASVYKTLAKPSVNYPKSMYTAVDANLYHDVLIKYMDPEQS